MLNIQVMGSRYFGVVVEWNSTTVRGGSMINPQSVSEPFSFWFIREFLTSENDRTEETKPIDDKEFYSVLAMLFAGVVILALTIGPFAIV